MLSRICIARTARSEERELRLQRKKVWNRLANTILLQMTKKTLEEEASAYVDPEKEVTYLAGSVCRERAIFMAETISDDADYRIRIRSLTQKEGKIVNRSKG